MGGTSDRDEIVELLARYASMPDTKEWDELPTTVFTDLVMWDFEGVGAGPAREVARSDLVDGLRSFFARWEATHHAVTNHLIDIDGDRATVRAHIHAQHWLPADVATPPHNRWLVVGFYDDIAVRTEDGWRLRSVRLTLSYQEHPPTGATR